MNIKKLNEEIENLNNYTFDVSLQNDFIAGADLNVDYNDSSFTVLIAMRHDDQFEEEPTYIASGKISKAGEWIVKPDLFESIYETDVANTDNFSHYVINEWRMFCNDSDYKLLLDLVSERAEYLGSEI